jgi:hypothetical protein
MVRGFFEPHFPNDNSEFYNVLGSRRHVNLNHIYFSLELDDHQWAKIPVKTHQGGNWEPHFEEKIILDPMGQTLVNSLKALREAGGSDEGGSKQMVDKVHRLRLVIFENGEPLAFVDILNELRQQHGESGRDRGSGSSHGPSSPTADKKVSITTRVITYASKITQLDVHFGQFRTKYQKAVSLTIRYVVI